MFIKARAYMSSRYYQDSSSVHENLAKTLRLPTLIDKKIAKIATNPIPLKEWRFFQKVKWCFKKIINPTFAATFKTISDEITHLSNDIKVYHAVYKKMKDPKYKDFPPHDDDHEDKPPPPPPPPQEISNNKKLPIIKNLMEDEELLNIYNASTRSKVPLETNQTSVQYLNTFTLNKAVLPFATDNITTPFLDRSSHYDEVPQPVYPMLFPLTCMQSPTNSGPNFESCISVRILGATYPDSKEGVWENSKNFFPTDCVNDVLSPNKTYDEWFDSLKPVQRKKIEDITLLEEIDPSLLKRQKKN